LAFRVDVEQRLDVVIPRGQLSEALHGVPEGGLVNDGGLTGLQTVHVNAEKGCRVRRDLQPWLRVIGASDDEEDTAGNRSEPEGFFAGDFKPRVGLRHRAEQCGKENDNFYAGKAPHGRSPVRSFWRVGDNEKVTTGALSLQ